MTTDVSSGILIPYASDPIGIRVELAVPVATEPTLEKLAYTYAEAAKALSVSESTIKRQVKVGLIEVVSIGKLKRIPVASLHRLLNQ